MKIRKASHDQLKNAKQIAAFRAALSRLEDICGFPPTNANAFVCELPDKTAFTLVKQQTNNWTICTEQPIKLRKILAALHVEPQELIWK